MTHPHTLVGIVTLLSLLVLIATIVRVGKARATFGVAAPATTGHEMFERHFRIQMNTVEQLILFLPSLWLFAIYWQNQYIPAVLGLVWIVGRILYMTSYAKDPSSRELGFGLTAVPMLILLIGGLIGAVRVMVITGLV
jgi:glutathione S-transferase